VSTKVDKHEGSGVQTGAYHNPDTRLDEGNQVRHSEKVSTPQCNLSQVPLLIPCGSGMVEEGFISAPSPLRKNLTVRHKP
jgi:hypothetical protein